MASATNVSSDLSANAQRSSQLKFISITVGMSSGSTVFALHSATPISWNEWLIWLKSSLCDCEDLSRKLRWNIPPIILNG